MSAIISIPIPVDRLLPDLKEVLKDDMRLFEFLKGLLEEKYVTQRGCKEKILFENKGIMAGTPIASFYADLYLKSWTGLFMTDI